MHSAARKRIGRSDPIGHHANTAIAHVPGAPPIVGRLDVEIEHLTRQMGPILLIARHIQKVTF